MAKLSKRIPALRLNLTAFVPLPNGFADAAAASAAITKATDAMKEAGLVQVAINRQTMTNVLRPDAPSDKGAGAGTGDGKQGSDGSDKAGAGKAGKGS